MESNLFKMLENLPGKTVPISGCSSSVNVLERHEPLSEHEVLQIEEELKYCLEWVPPEEKKQFVQDSIVSLTNIKWASSDTWAKEKLMCFLEKYL